MIKYREGYEIDYIRLMELFSESGRDNESTEYNRLVKMVENSNLVVTVWDFDYMVGFAQLTLDESLNRQIENLMVDLEYQNEGIEEELRRRILYI
ncbi:MAG: hypothetical protein ACOYIF_12565 [Acetivibrionales bacterium]